MPKWHRKKRTTRDRNTCLNSPTFLAFFFLSCCFATVGYCQWLDTVACYGSPQMLLVAWHICMLWITTDSASGSTHLYVTAHRRCCQWLDTFCMLRITTDTAGGLIHLYVTDHCGYCQWLDTFVCYRSSWILPEAWHICVLQIRLNTTGGLAHTHHSCCDQLTSSLCSWAVAMLVIS